MFFWHACTCSSRHSNLLSLARFASNHGLAPHIIQSNELGKGLSAVMRLTVIAVEDDIDGSSKCLK